MNAAEMSCPKCTCKMIRGFILDLNESQRIVTQWVEGEPKASFWSGVARTEKEPIPVGTFRCRKCGYLECYARYEFAAQ